MNKWMIYGAIMVLFIGADIVTKRLAWDYLQMHQTIYALDILPLTLTLNTGGGFSLSFGSLSHLIFPAISAVVFIVLLVVFRGTPHSMRFRLIALSLISAGAIGNLIDRVRWDLGVVDFIGPIDLGFMLWPIFNVADMAVSVGGVLLVFTFWGQESNSKTELESASGDIHSNASEQSAQAE